MPTELPSLSKKDGLDCLSRPDTCPGTTYTSHRPFDTKFTEQRGVP